MTGESIHYFFPKPEHLSELADETGTVVITINHFDPVPAGFEVPIAGHRPCCTGMKNPELRSWARPSRDGCLRLASGERPAVPGWLEVGSFDHSRMTTVWAPGALWRLWRLVVVLDRFKYRLLYPLAGRALVVLARLARVEFPIGLTVRGAAIWLGELVEEQRRATREGRSL